MDGGQAFKNINIELASGDCSVIFGGDGSGRSAILECFNDPDLITDGSYSNSALRVGIVSLESRSAYFARGNSR